MKNVVKSRIGQKVKGSLDARPLRTLLQEFLSCEEIWGYDGVKKSALDQEWAGRWDSLLEIVKRNYKIKMKHIHPDINPKEKELASNLTTAFNLIKSRLNNKIKPKFMPRSFTAKKMPAKLKVSKCMFCGEEITYKAGHAPKICKKKDCYNKRRVYYRHKGTDNPSRLNPKERTCANPRCGKKFVTTNNKKIFCDTKKCSVPYQSKLLKIRQKLKKGRD